jgi:hypothetical protein
MRRRQCLLLVHRADHRSPSAFLSASHAARWVACQGMRCHALVRRVFHPTPLRYISVDPPPFQPLI